MKTFVKTYKGLDIYFEAMDESISLHDLLPDDTDEQLAEIEQTNVIFCARVSAEINGIELGSDYLGGCIYENHEDFYIRYKDDNFADMVENVYQQSIKKAKELKDKLKQLNF